MGRPAKIDNVLSTVRMENVQQMFSRLQREIRDYSNELCIPEIEEYNPLIAMGKMAVNPATPMELQLRCHAELAAYMYPKLKSMEIALPPGSEAKITIEIQSYKSQEKHVDAQFKRDAGP